MKNIKKWLPNILTISRIIVTPLIIYLGIENKIIPLIILAAFIALTDFLDGKLARFFHVESEIGAKLDAIADKALAIGLLIILVVHNHLFFYILLLEAFISMFTLHVYFKTHIVESLLIGKIKTWVIFITIILGLINILIPNLKTFVNICVTITVFLQFMSLFNYIKVNNNRKKQKKKVN